MSTEACHFVSRARLAPLTSWRRQPIYCAAIFVLAAATSRPLVAQSASLAVSGARVRIAHIAPCCQSPLIGDLVAIDGDSLTIAPRVRGSEATATTIARRSVVSLEVWKRVGAHKALGVVIGSLVGGLTGAVVARNSCSRCDPEFRPFVTTVTTLGGGLLGSIVGTLVGYNIPHEEWTPSPLPTGKE